MAHSRMDPFYDFESQTLSVPTRKPSRPFSAKRWYLFITKIIDIVNLWSLIMKLLIKIIVKCEKMWS